MDKFSIKPHNGGFIVYKNGIELKVLANRFKLEQFLTVLWENGELSYEAMSVLRAS